MKPIGYSIKKEPIKQQINIDLLKKHIKLECLGVSFVDKDTNMYIAYLPALDISGYGDTLEEADKILNLSVKEYCKHLLHLKSEEIHTEVIGMGWANEKSSTENYSRPYVGIDGKLQGFNVLNEQVELFNLETIG